jgi:hypothetical protein
MALAAQTAEFTRFQTAVNMGAHLADYVEAQARRCGAIRLRGAA